MEKASTTINKLVQDGRLGAALAGTNLCAVLAHRCRAAVAQALARSNHLQMTAACSSAARWHLSAAVAGSLHRKGPSALDPGKRSGVCVSAEELCCVVVDELHMVGDGQRGLTLETLLTKLRFSAAARHVQVPALTSG